MQNYIDLATSFMFVGGILEFISIIIGYIVLTVFDLFKEGGN